MIQMNMSPGLIALHGNLQVYGMILFVWDEWQSYSLVKRTYRQRCLH